MRVRQPKGMKHAKLIKRRAIRLWRKNALQKGLWIDCLKTEIENHRKLVEAQILSEKTEELIEYQCDNNGWIG